jgi:hypothetical protein
MRIIFKLRGVTVNHRVRGASLSTVNRATAEPAVHGLRNLASEIQNAVVDEAKLQFAGELYDRCLEQYGEDHYRTRLASACLGRARGIELSEPACEDAVVEVGQET